MQDDCVARELPSEVWSAKILLWSSKKMNNKVDKWGGWVFGFFFQ
jgi:hypothetical protein